MRKIHRVKRNLSKSIVIVGEGFTEVLYFDCIRRVIRHNYTLKACMGFNSDYASVFNKAAQLLNESNYDLALCVLDVDGIVTDGKLQEFVSACKRLDKRIVPVPSNPCIEFWFLLHMWKTAPGRYFESFSQLEPEIRKIWPGYEKSKEFLAHGFFKKLDSGRKHAIGSADEIISRNNLTRENFGTRSFTEIGRLFRLLDVCNACRSESGCGKCKEKAGFFLQS